MGIGSNRGEVVRSWAGRVASGMMDLLCPPRCLLCDRFTTDLVPGERDWCPECLEGFKPLPSGYGGIGGAPFKSDRGSVHTCGACRKKRPVYDRAIAAGMYEDKLRQAVHALKYNGRTELAGPLADYMVRHLDAPFYPAQADLILPVPLHKNRLRSRGFNQALLLAKALFRGDDARRIRHDVLHRLVDTTPQVNLKGEERRKNVRGAFAVSVPETVRGKGILLMDDVYTTGATINECARVLKKAGALSVWALTLARVG
jgi:ComF family protein